ncbi:MAG: zf-HC2 domain-containing protein [Phycisphaerae bacterium]|nr:zf-HC2 domain-containing protein [Phycisphaerae bacterium]
MSRYDCIDFKVSLSAYLDGEGSPDARAAADRHLLECRPCRDLLEQAERNDAIIRRLCEMDADAAESLGSGLPLPRGFEEAVLARTRRRSRVAWHRVYQSFGLLSAAAAIALATALYFVVQANRDGAGRDSQTTVSETTTEDGWEALRDDIYGPPRPPRDLLARANPRAVLPLTRDDLQALNVAAATVEAIIATPFEDLAARDRLRRTSEYDELLDRLGRVRTKVDPAGRRIIDAARASFFQLERDRPELELWNQLQDDLRLMNLPESLDEIAASGPQGGA